MNWRLLGYIISDVVVAFIMGLAAMHEYVKGRLGLALWLSSFIIVMVPASYDWYCKNIVRCNHEEGEAGC